MSDQSPRTAPVTLVLDVDGTLVDSNYQHALAWYLAFRTKDITVPVWQVHRAIGMGGDQLVEHLAGAEVEQRDGDALRDEWKRQYEQMEGEVSAFAQTEPMLAAATEAGCAVVLASSGEKEQVERSMQLFDGERYADAWTTSDDAEASKPAPDLLEVALTKLQEKGMSTERAIMVGDSTWDAIAAGKAGLPCIAVRTGGFDPDELREAGAAVVLEDLDELRELITSGELERELPGWQRAVATS